MKSFFSHPSKSKEHSIKKFSITISVSKSICKKSECDSNMLKIKRNQLSTEICMFKLWEESIILANHTAVEYIISFNNNIQ